MKGLEGVTQELLRFRVELKEGRGVGANPTGGSRSA